MTARMYVCVVHGLIIARLQENRCIVIAALLSVGAVMPFISYG